ncbi:hypothetical protein Ancab_030062 [Ancistrocladus abbreviatus]
MFIINQAKLERRICFDCWRCIERTNTGINRRSLSYFRQQIKLRLYRGDQCRTSDINSLRIGSIEVEVKHHLERARIQVLSSKNVDQEESKKLLDAPISMLMKEFYSLCDEKDRVDQFISARTCMDGPLFLAVDANICNDHCL